MRGNYAGIGDIYDSTNDVFYKPKPQPSWVLNTKKWIWESPLGDHPDDDYIYYWDEDAYQADNTTGWKRYE